MTLALHILQALVITEGLSYPNRQWHARIAEMVDAGWLMRD